MDWMLWLRGCFREDQVMNDTAPGGATTRSHDELKNLICEEERLSEQCQQHKRRTEHCTSRLDS